MKHETDRYEIRVDGHLPARWAIWFDGLTVITQPDGTTVIRGTVPDQAALHGLLERTRDMGLRLLSVTPQLPAEPAPTAPPAQTQGDTP